MNRRSSYVEHGLPSRNPLCQLTAGSQAAEKRTFPNVAFATSRHYLGYYASALSKTFAFFRSGVSKPSVNQP